MLSVAEIVEQKFVLLLGNSVFTIYIFHQVVSARIMLSVRLAEVIMSLRDVRSKRLPDFVSMTSNVLGVVILVRVLIDGNFFLRDHFTVFFYHSFLLICEKTPLQNFVHKRLLSSPFLDYFFEALSSSRFNILLALVSKLVQTRGLELT
jgi:hypothetical protein